MNKCSCSKLNPVSNSKNDIVKLGVIKHKITCSKAVAKNYIVKVFALKTLSTIPLQVANFCC